MMTYHNNNNLFFTFTKIFFIFCKNEKRLDKLEFFKNLDFLRTCHFRQFRSCLPYEDKTFNKE